MVGHSAQSDLPKSEQFSQPTNSQSTCPATQSALPKHISQTIHHPNGASSQSQRQGNKSWPQRNPEEKRVSRQPCKSTWSLHSYQGCGNSPAVQLSWVPLNGPRAGLSVQWLSRRHSLLWLHKQAWRPESQMETLKHLTFLVPGWRQAQSCFPEPSMMTQPQT